MASFIEIALLVFIAWFLVAREPNGWLERLAGRRRSRLILDSCALIDGRIVEIAASSFLSDELIIPQFILSELQLLADGSDSHKRERARFGLDIAHQLQDAGPLPVVIDPATLPEVSAIDDKLVALAQKLHARLYTTDFNLGKVAAVKGVRVLNVNELAQSMRPVTLPGEKVEIKIIQKGSGHSQGVGYLDDGTMIVVENAARLVGKTVPVVVTRMHQTVSGKMVFGHVKLAEKPASASSKVVTKAASQSHTPAKDVRSAETPTRRAAPASAPQQLHHRLRRI